MVAKVTIIAGCILLLLFLSCHREDHWPNDKCSLTNLEIETGKCTSPSTYDLTLNFKYHNAGNKFFNVYARNNKLIGTFKLADLPLTIKDFKRSGNEYDFIKIVINEHPDCFVVAEFKPPVCEEGECKIAELKTSVGACNADGTYHLLIDFKHQDAGNQFFNVFVRNDKLIGTYKLADLPLTLKNFQRSGNVYDFIKIAINDKPGCFVVAEFKPPACKEESCAITDLKTDIGECTSDSTYNLKINFEHHNAGNDYFDVFIRNNIRIGTYKLKDLPLTIKNFKVSGKDFDYLRICINDKADCCKAIEFKAPGCK